MSKLTKSDMFMLAYIFFLLICFLVSCIIGDFPLWSQLVAAVTVASTMFAISDVLQRTGKEVEDVYNLQTPKYEFLISKCTQLGLFEQESVKNAINAKLPSKSKRKELFKYMGEKEKALCNLIWKNKENNRLKKRFSLYYELSKSATFLGFLFLLCVMAFSKHFSLQNETCMRLSIVAFIFILIAQIADNLSNNYLEERKKEIDSFFDECKKLIESKQHCAGVPSDAD